MKKTMMILLFLGLLLEYLGFLLAFPEHFQYGFNLVSQDYQQASFGMERLVKGQDLRPNDQGFEEISELYFSIIREQNHSDLTSKISVEAITRTREICGVAYGLSGVKNRIPLAIQLSNGQKGKWDLEMLRTQVEKMKNETIFWASLGLFWGGVAVQMIGFRLT